MGSYAIDVGVDRQDLPPRHRCPSLFVVLVEASRMPVGVHVKVLASSRWPAPCSNWPPCTSRLSGRRSGHHQSFTAESSDTREERRRLDLRPRCRQLNRQIAPFAVPDVIEKRSHRRSADTLPPSMMRSTIRQHGRRVIEGAVTDGQRGHLNSRSRSGSCRSRPASTVHQIPESRNLSRGRCHRSEGLDWMRR